MLLKVKTVMMVLVLKLLVLIVMGNLPTLLLNKAALPS